MTAHSSEMDDIPLNTSREGSLSKQNNIGEKNEQIDEEAGESHKRSKIKIYPLIVCATSFFVQFFVLGFHKSFGPIYVSLLKEFNSDAASTSWVGSLSVCVQYLATPFAFKVINKIHFRAAMALGAMLSGLGLLVSSYADSIHVLYITYGLMFGIGSSLCYSCSVLILPQYFTTNWSLAHGIALSGNGLGGLGLSPANNILIERLGLRTGMKVMAATSFTVLMAASMIYQTPESYGKEIEPDTNDDEFEDEEEDEYDDLDDYENIDDHYYPPTLIKNKPVLIFFLSSYLLNFGYYVPYVHLVKMAIDYNIDKTQASLLPGYLSLSQSFGKVFIGKVFSYESVNRVFAYQISLVILSIATTFVPILYSYTGLFIYAIVFGFSDGCGQATNMLIVGDIVGKRLLPKAYSTYLVCSASAFVVGPPLAGFVYNSTGKYSIAFFMCGALAFASAAILFMVPCLEDEQQMGVRQERKQRLMEKKMAKKEAKREPKKNTDVGRRDSGISDVELVSSSRDESKPIKLDVSQPKQDPTIALLNDIHEPGVAETPTPRRPRRRRAPSHQRSSEFNKALLTRSWHSIDFRPRKRSESSNSINRRRQQQQQQQQHSRPAGPRSRPNLAPISIENRLLGSGNKSKSQVTEL